MHEANSCSCSGEIHLSAKSLRNDSSDITAQVTNVTPTLCTWVLRGCDFVEPSLGTERYCRFCTRMGAPTVFSRGAGVRSEENRQVISAGTNIGCTQTVIYGSAEYAVYQNSRKLAMTMGFSTIKTNPIATGQNPIRSSPQTSLRTIRLPPRPASRDDHDDALDHKRDDQNQMNDRDHASHRMRAQRNRKGYTCLDSQLASGLRMSISVGTTQTCTLR
jgi:hypothetical protein